jgi:hypothetical protein
MAHFIPIYLQTLMSALEPNDCNGICHNTLGGYYCTHCCWKYALESTGYDPLVGSDGFDPLWCKSPNGPQML